MGLWVLYWRLGGIRWCTHRRWIGGKGDRKKWENFLSFSKELEQTKREKNITSPPLPMFIQPCFNNSNPQRIGWIKFVYCFMLLFMSCCWFSVAVADVAAAGVKRKSSSWSSVVVNSAIMSCRTQWRGKEWRLWVRWRNYFSQRLQPCNWYHSAETNKDIEIMVSQLIMIQNNNNTESFVFDLSMWVKLLLL